jgi:hypothetical protein
MSRITNDRIKPGDPLTAASLNDKFAAVTAATTTSLNGENVRNEAIDIGNVVGAGTTPDLIIKHVSQDNTAVSATYPANTVEATILTSAAFPTQTLENTDIIRVYWQVEVTNRTFVMLADGTAGANDDLLGGLFWCVWLQWYNVGSAAWEAVPGQDDYGTYSGKNGFRSTNCSALMPMPAYIRSTQNAGTINDQMIIPRPGTAGTTYNTALQAMSFMGTYVRRGDGSNPTYNQLRLQLRGYFRGSNDATPASYIEVCPGSTYVNTYNITTTNITLGHILMKAI